ncbi:MAG: ankyrin repeat domain-containing protein [Sphingobacteriia bacterium]|nr:ankyrin repeat domain-containing protein [Sphingobacteriia bacterium]
MSKEQLPELNNPNLLDNLPEEIIWEIIKDFSLKDVNAFISSSKYNQKLYTKFIEGLKKRIKEGNFKGSPIEIIALYRLYEKAFETRDITTLLKLPMHIKVIDLLHKKYQRHPFTNLVIWAFVNENVKLQQELSFPHNFSDNVEIQEQQNAPNLLQGFPGNLFQGFPGNFFQGLPVNAAPLFPIFGQVNQAVEPSALPVENNYEEVFTEEELQTLRLYEGVSGVTPFGTIANQIQLRDILALDDTQVTEEHVKKLHVLIKDRKTLFTKGNISVASNEVKEVLLTYQELINQAIKILKNQNGFGLETLQNLLESGLNPNAIGNPLSYLNPMNMNIEALKELITNGFNCKAYFKSSERSAEDGIKQYINIIHAATQLQFLFTNSTDVLKELIPLFIENGADINGNNFYYYYNDYKNYNYTYTPITPLHQALDSNTFSQSLNITSILIDYGASMNIFSKNCIMSIDGSEFKIDERSLLDQICFSYDPMDSKKFLLNKLKEFGFDFNIKDSKGRTFIHKMYQAIFQHGLRKFYDEKLKPLLPILIELGVDVNAQDNEGNTILHYATQDLSYAHIHILVDLYKHIDMDLSIKNYMGQTIEEMAKVMRPVSFKPMLEICYTAGLNLIKLNLLRKKIANPSLNITLNPEHMNKETIKILLNNKAIIRPPFNKFQQTPLHIAVINSDVKEVRRLLNEGAPVDIKDCYGNTPLHYAFGAKGPYEYKFAAPNPIILVELYSHKFNYIFDFKAISTTVDDLINFMPNNAQIRPWTLADGVHNYNILQFLLAVKIIIKQEKEIKRLENDLKNAMAQYYSGLNTHSFEQSKRKKDDEDDNDRSFKRIKVEQTLNNGFQQSRK